MFEILIYIFKGIFQLLMWTWWVIVPVIAIIAFQNFRKSKWAESLESIVLTVRIPKNSEKGPTSAEMMFASLHGILKPTKELKKEGAIQEHISFEMVADAKSIIFYVWAPKHLQNFVEGQIYAQYPTAEISVVEDYSKNIDIDHDGKDDCVAGCELKLVKPDYFPIKTFVSFEVDPLAGITGALSKIENPDEKVWIQIITRPVSDNWRNKGLAYAEGLKSGKGPKMLSKEGVINGLIQLPALVLSTVFEAIFPSDEKGGGGGGETKIPHNVETSLACLEEKANKLGYQVKIRLLYIAKSRELAKQHLRITAGAFKQFNTTLANGFVPTKIRTGRDVLDEYRARLFTDKGFVLNIEEVASLYHLPHASVETPNIVWTSSKKGEPPANLPYEEMVDEKGLTAFADTTFRGQPRGFGIKKDDRRRHMYIIGKSGTGKSKLLEILAVNDIEKGEGIGIVDPHGTTVQDVMKRIPSHRVNDVVYFKPIDKDNPIGFNPLETTPDFREETTSGFIAALKRLFGYSWGPRLEYVLRYTVLALTYSPDATMLSIVRMLTDKDYRKKVLEKVEDPVVKTFWLKEWSTYNDRFQAEAVAPILNKVGQFTASPIIRNIVGQVNSTINFGKIMNEQKILLVDLSGVGEDNAELLGSFIITKIQLSAMARTDLSEESLKDFYLYVDEFQNFATESFATILSEARKYKLNLTLANQYIAQMEETVRDAVFGNVGTLISFRVGATDAAYLEKEFAPVFEKDDLINLDNRHIYLYMLIDGVTSQPFSAMTKTIEPLREDANNTEKIIKSSREKYSIPKQEIESKIIKWTNIDSFDAGKVTEKKTAPRVELNKKQIKNSEKKVKDVREAINKNKPQAPIQGPQGREETPIKKSIDPEELKKIIQKVTQPTALPKKEAGQEGEKTDALKKTGPNLRIKGSNMEQAKDSAVSPEREKTQIKITKITGGAEIERVKAEEPAASEAIVKNRPRIQPQYNKINPVEKHPINQDQIRRSINPLQSEITRVPGNPLIKNVSSYEEENIRRITREEFMDLKEILPNEKIVIIDKKEGETQRGSAQQIK